MKKDTTDDNQHLWLAPTLGVFLRKVAIDYARYGYVRYIYRKIPLYKDPELIDKKMIEHYGITWNRVARAKRHGMGEAKITYIRWGHKWILMATEGNHPEFEKRNYLNLRLNPLSFSGYSVGLAKNGKVYVRVAPRRYSAIKKAVGKIALHNHQKVTGFIAGIAHINFPETIRQKQALTRYANRKRKLAGLKKLPDPIVEVIQAQENKRRFRLIKQQPAVTTIAEEQVIQSQTKVRLRPG